jgi:hypothetical protein
MQVLSRRLEIPARHTHSPGLLPEATALSAAGNSRATAHGPNQPHRLLALRPATHRRRHHHRLLWECAALAAALTSAATTSPGPPPRRLGSAALCDRRTPAPLWRRGLLPPHQGPTAAGRRSREGPAALGFSPESPGEATRGWVGVLR